jgi:hypothetical protein
MKDFSWSEVCLMYKMYVNTVLTKEMIQFQLPAENTIGVPASQPQGFNLVCPIKPCCRTQL